MDAVGIGSGEALAATAGPVSPYQAGRPVPEDFLPHEHPPEVEPRLQRVDPSAPRGYAEPHPTWVTILPSAQGEERIDFVGRRIARRLGLSYRRSIVRHREAGPYPTAFDIVDAPTEPVLLVHAPIDRDEVDVVSDLLRAAGVPEVFAVQGSSPVGATAPDLPFTGSSPAYGSVRERTLRYPRRYPGARPIDPAVLGEWVDEDEGAKPSVTPRQVPGQEQLIPEAVPPSETPSGRTLVKERAAPPIEEVDEDRSVLGRALAAARANGHEMGPVKSVRYGQDDRHMVECTKCGAAMIVTVNVHDGTRQRNLGIPREGPTADQKRCPYRGWSTYS